MQIHKTIPNLVTVNDFRVHRVLRYKILAMSLI